MSTTPDKPPRKFPAPCWTQDEALALIDAYRERWYALRRGYLRTADWDAVAAVVVHRCPAASPSKTSAQCRHKMEKLRQRYRAEKQRSLSFPGRFFSSWFFFDHMDFMVNGQNADNRVETPGDRNLVESVAGTKNCKKTDRNSDNCSPNFGSRVLNGYSSNLDGGSDEDVGDDADFGGGFGVKIPIDGKFVAPVFKGKKLGKNHGNFGPNFDSNHGDGGGFRVKAQIDQHLVPPGFRAKKFKKVGGNFSPNFDYSDGGFRAKMSGDGYSVSAGFRAKSCGKSGPNLDSSDLKRSDGRGVKRERSEIAEMVSSIKMLGEGFVEMEKMKMEMVREMEKMRMEMEMKRNELVLESQRQIVDAFVTLIRENKKKKENTTVLPES